MRFFYKNFKRLAIIIINMIFAASGVFFGLIIGSGLAFNFAIVLVMFLINFVCSIYITCKFVPDSKSLKEKLMDLQKERSANIFAPYDKLTKEKDA